MVSRRALRGRSSRRGHGHRVPKALGISHLSHGGRSPFQGGKGYSRLNMVEAWFSILTRKSVRRSSFDSVRSLIQHIRNYINHWNLKPRPFVWTRQPADIIGKAVRRER